MSRRKLSEKQENTIKRMKENRINDGITLRKTLEEKLSWAINEKKTGESVIERQMLQIRENKEIVMKLGAIIDLLTDLLREKEVENKEDSKKE